MAESENSTQIVEGTNYMTVTIDPTTYFSPKSIKQEINIDEDMAIPCRLCTKTFGNPTALRNHVRVLHMCESVDIEEWLQDVSALMSDNQIKKEPVAQGPLDQQTVAAVASMRPFNLSSFAADGVQYVIVKAKNFGNGIVPMIEKPPTKKEKEAKEKEIVRMKEKANAMKTDPITGPFECLQPSSVFSAGVCHQIFFSCCEYSAHFRDEHTRRRKSQKCQVCEKLLTTSDGQEQEFPYMCQVCGAGFPLAALLAAHSAQQHVKLKPYQCPKPACRKRFTQQGGLQQHLRLHSGDRPYPCNFCGKAFTQKSGLDQHLRIHTKVKPYRCVICHKTFCQSVHLKQHMRTHTNVTPFQCAICEKKFKQSSHLNYHLKYHTEANMTDDQKRRYRELVGLLQQQRGGEGAGEEEAGEAEAGEAEEEEAGGEVVEVEERGYMLSDNGDETWTVLVDGQAEEVVLG